MYRLENTFCLGQNLLSRSEISIKNRIWTPRDQFSADSGVRGFYFRRGQCIATLPRVTDSRRSIKTVSVDQVESGDPLEPVSELSRGGRHI